MVGMTLIPSFQTEIEEGRQELLSHLWLHRKFKVNLGYLRPYLKNNKMFVQPLTEQPQMASTATGSHLRSINEMSPCAEGWLRSSGTPISTICPSWDTRNL